MISVPPEIADQIVGYIYEESLEQHTEQRRQEELKDLPPRPSCWNYSLLRLRLTSKSFQGAVDRALFKIFKIDKLSLWSLVRIKRLLDSPSVCSAVRTYSLAPRVCLVRPVVKRDVWGHYGEFADSCASYEPSYSHMENMHAMRKEVAKHYDEQLRLMQLDGWWIDWLWIGLERLLRRSEVAPRTTNLKTLPYFSSVPKLSNLKKLAIGYSIPQSRQDTRIHYLIKNDLSAGLATILQNAPAHLSSIEIMFPTLTDLRNVVYFTNQGTPRISLPQVRCLEITFTQETLVHRGRIIDTRSRVHGHTAGGKPIADLIGFFPNIEILELMYSQDYHDGAVVLQNFNPAPMKHLKRLLLRAMAIDPSVLLDMTDKQAAESRKNPFKMKFIDVALFSGGSSWYDVLSTWKQRGLLNEAPGSALDRIIVYGPLMYLNREICSEQALASLILHEETLLYGLTTEELDSLETITLPQRLSSLIKNLRHYQWRDI